MELHEAVELIKPALWSPQRSSVWADLGSGEGLFTHALANLLGPGSTIHAVDKSNQIIEPSHNNSTIFFHQLDFTRDALPFTDLDGILMANSIHFVQDKRGLIAQLKTILRENGQLVIIEYELVKGNHWVPYPIPYDSLQAQLTESGFKEVQRVGERRSLYAGRKMYVCKGIKV